MMTNERWTCSRCAMSFRIEERPSSKCSSVRCPDCRLLFWHGVLQVGRGVAIGISARELAT